MGTNAKPDFFKGLNNMNQPETTKLRDLLEEGRDEIRLMINEIKEIEPLITGYLTAENFMFLLGWDMTVADAKSELTRIIQRLRGI
jgi:hypothetical protein